MENFTSDCEVIYNEFRDTWTVDKVKQMTLDQYVSVGEKDTFCYWLEIKTRILGSIKGIFSFKFGIYKRRDKSKTSKRLCNDDDYSWQPFYSQRDRNEAFNKIRNEILQIIDYADKGQFKKIDTLHLTQFVKWKIAFLYSNERLIPIYKKEWLVNISKHLGLEANNRTPISEIQEVMMANKPVHLSVYEYMMELCGKFGKDGDTKANGVEARKITSRRAATGKNTETQTRRGATNYVATQKHNILQEALYERLVAKYGAEHVKLEKDFVDIKVVQPEMIFFYEVKSSPFASRCIIEALGQIMEYTHRNNDPRPKQLIIAGQFKPYDNEVNFITFVKENLKLHLDYESIDLD